MKKLSLILLFSLGALSAFAQQRITLDLQQTIALANDSSLEAFRTKNMYLAGYWEYRTYKANRLPSLTLNMTPHSTTAISPSVTTPNRTLTSIAASNPSMHTAILPSDRIST